MWQSCWQRHLKGKNTCSRANEIPRGIKNEIQNELIASQKAIVSPSFCKARLAQKQDARIVFRNTNCVFSVSAIFVDLLLSFYRSFHVSCRLTVRAFRWSLPCGWVDECPCSSKDVSILITFISSRGGFFQFLCDCEVNITNIDKVSIYQQGRQRGNRPL